MTPKPESHDGESETIKSEDETPTDAIDLATPSTKAPAKRRTKTGCLTCRRRRIKCSEEKPFCKNCVKSKRECFGYVQPLVYKQQQGLAGQDASSRRPSTIDYDHQSYPLSAQSDSGAFRDYGIHQASPYEYPMHESQLGHMGPVYGYPDPSYVAQQHAMEYDSGNVRRHSLNNQPPRHYFNEPHHYQQLHEPYHQPHVDYQYGHLNSSHGVMTYHPASSDIQPNTPLEYAAPYGLQSRRYSVQDTFQPDRWRPRVPKLVTPGITATQPGYGEEVSDADSEAENAMEEEAVAGTHLYSRPKLSAKDLQQRNSLRRHQPGMMRSLRQNLPKSPLFDERNERIFQHFVDVLGHIMSTFERVPDTSSMTSHHLWSYKMAAAAFSNPALAHAILAVSGLHIAKIQQSSESTSLKHFTSAARRVGRLLGVMGKRHEATTLATVLLLGYYEMLNADHSRWNLHLAGAAKLVSEHNVKRMVRMIRRARRRALQISMNSGHQPMSSFVQEEYVRQGIAPSLFDELEWDVDENLIKNLTGVQSSYDDQESHVLETPGAQMMTESEISEYRTTLDLWWWFCKQDLFQSMVSGERLLMPFEHNISCPPRGKFGVADRAFATFDHLVLLMSRLSNFGGKDRHRKQRAILAQGGQWIPPMWLRSGSGPPRSNSTDSLRSGTTTDPMRSGSRRDKPTTSLGGDPRTDIKSDIPSANESRIRHNKPRSEAAPPATSNAGFGMMPPSSEAPKMHSAFLNMEKSINEGATQWNASKQADSPGSMTMEEEISAAYIEHQQVQHAFDLFRSSLGTDFDPIPNEGQHTTSPFGPPLRYRSPEIACLWAHYYVGRVLLFRLHPDMPAAAVVAAGVTAALTKTYTQTVGQICAGLFASLPAVNSTQALSPRLAAALMDISFAVLFCGIQYIDPAQRGWTVTKLHNIAQMTGWQTSAAVAAACEIAWEKTAQAGRGPPYTRSLDRTATDARLNGSYAPLMPQYTSPVSEVVSEHESQFVNHDRSLISKHGPSRVHWAMGLLSVEEDVRQMNIGAE